MCDYPRIFKCINRKARKTHKCYECGKIIKTGETYQNVRGNWEGKWYEFKTCLFCEDLRDRLKDYGELAPFGELREWASDAQVLFPVEG